MYESAGPVFLGMHMRRGGVRNELTSNIKLGTFNPFCPPPAKTLRIQLRLRVLLLL